MRIYGLSQGALTERNALRRTYAEDIERGERNVSLINFENFEKLAKTVKVKLTRVLKGAEKDF